MNNHILYVSLAGGRCSRDLPKGGVCYSILATLMATNFVPRQEALGLLLAVLLGLLCLPSMVVTSPSGTPCPPAPGRSETCVCKSDKGIIDLTSLSKNDGTPRYFCSQLPG